MSAEIISFDRARWVRSDIEAQAENAAATLERSLAAVRGARRSLVGATEPEIDAARGTLETIIRDCAEISALARDVQTELASPLASEVAELSAAQKARMSGHPSMRGE